jgi:catalase
MRQTADSGRVAYEPNSLDADGPREDPEQGFSSLPAPEEGPKQRIPSESFADHRRVSFGSP